MGEKHAPTAWRCRREAADADARKLSEVRFKEVSVRYRAFLTEGRRELPERLQRKNKKGRIPKSEAENLLDTFETYETKILRFACQSEVPCSNNRAERDIRMAKVIQKVSGTFRNFDHAQAYCRISSYTQSISYQGYSSLAAVQIALNGYAVQMLDQPK